MRLPWKRNAEPAVVPALDTAALDSAVLDSAALDTAAEMNRQDAVDALRIVDTPAEDRFDRIVAMAQKLYRTDAAIFSIVDHDREWLKARVGTSLEQVPRADSFCSVTIQQEGAFVVADTRHDKRFRENPGVTGELGIRFYAGVPITSRNGEAIGALCVLDRSPRDESTVDKSMLEQLALLIQAELRVRPAYALLI